ncbi:MAG: RICIN domain-containing protein [Ruminococcus sp.]|nr:RICIN domain-containing protein [Ruminococcus sp.]
MKKRILSLFMVLIFFAVPFAFISDVEMQSKAITQDEIVQKANYLYNLKWTSQANFNGYINSKGTLTKSYQKGGTYRIPYGMPVSSGGFIGYGISVENFIAATKSANNPFYNKRASYEKTNSNYYSMDCSTFVSYCWGLSSRKTTATLPNVSTKIGKCNSANIDKLQVGDALNINGPNDYHVVLITNISNGNIEITEETPPEIKRTKYSKTEIVSKYGNYDILRYADPNPPLLPGTIDNSYKQPIDVRADHQINTYDDHCNQESGRWIDSGDNCYIEAVYTNGFVKVQYPVSSGKRWAYAKRDDFNIPKADTKWYSGLKPENLGDEFLANIVISEWNKCLTNDGDMTTFRSKTGQANQIWRFVRNKSDGSYRIKSTIDNKSLDVRDGKSDFGTRIGIWEDNDTASQKWTIYKINGSYYFKPACSDGTLDLNGGNFYEGVSSQIWEKNDSAAQKFSITKWYSELTPVDIGDNWYGYIINNKEWKPLTNDGENVSFRNGTGAYNQIWRFTKNTDGSYKITSLADGKVLDVAEGSSSNGTNIGVYENHNANNQKWYIYGSSGQHFLRAACTDCVLDLDGGKFYEGVNVQMWEKMILMLKNCIYGVLMKHRN